MSSRWCFVFLAEFSTRSQILDINLKNKRSFDPSSSMGRTELRASSHTLASLVQYSKSSSVLSRQPTKRGTFICMYTYTSPLSKGISIFLVKMMTSWGAHSTSNFYDLNHLFFKMHFIDNPCKIAKSKTFETSN